MGIYAGQNSVAKKVKNIYVGVNGIARKVSKVYIGVNGVARLCYSSFPDAPSSYSLLSSYIEGGVFTWAAPSDGYYQIEVQGASGAGGNYLFVNSYGCGGGGGGGGGCAISRVKMNKGDTITLYVSYSGYTNYAVINSSVESYDNPTVTSGANGGNAYTVPHATQNMQQGVGGAGGAGGRASGGNYANHNGGSGANGSAGSINTDGTGGAGGAPGYSGGRSGGNGGTRGNIISGTTIEPGAGSTGFIKIYAGDTNLT